MTTACSPGAAWNATEWDHPRFNGLMAEARAELDEGLRAEMYREIQIILRDEGGMIAPMFANAIVAHNQNLAHNEQSWIRAFDGRRICERWWVV